MSESSDIGISPVLLQAISQSLSSAKASPALDSPTSKMASSAPPTNGKGAAENVDLMAKILEQQHQQQQQQIAPESVSENKDNQPVTSETIKTMLKIKMAANVLAANALSSITGDTSDLSASKVTEGRSDFASDIAMANVLTALASQSGRIQAPLTLDTGQLPATTATSTSLLYEAMKMSQGEKEHEINNKTEATQLLRAKLLLGAQDSFETISPQVSIQSAQNTNYTIIKSEPAVTNMRQSLATKVISTSEPPDFSSDVASEISVTTENATLTCASGAAMSLPTNIVDSNFNSANASKSKSDNPLLFSLNPTPGTSSSDENIIDISSGSSVRIIEHNGKRFIIQMQDIEKTPAAGTTVSVTQAGVTGTASSSGESVAVSDDPLRYSVSQDNDSLPYTCIAEQEVVTVGQQQESSSLAGYKPSVSNTIAMVGQPCPVCGDSVSGFHYGIFTCESCKGFFKRTVQNKKTFVCPRQGECEITLENRKKCPACRFAKCLVMGMKLEAIRHDRTRGGRSSYGGSSLFEEPKKKRPIKIVQQRRVSATPPQAESTLVSVLSSGPQTPDHPFVPQVLTHIMSLESLLCDDDIPANISVDDFQLSNPNVFMTLLQLCELKLYKIVRWARNLPYFANISTDDQILLLQNCWCELLALTMCWKSLHLTNEIIFFHGQSLDQEKAEMLNLSEMFTKMLMVVEQFKRLKLDQYECVALKVIILICPDIKGLSEESRLQEQQQKVSIALEQYVSSHYGNTPNKYGELLLRLPELSRISAMMKNQLVNWMPSNTTSCGLLYELLKGENMKDLL